MATKAKTTKAKTTKGRRVSREPTVFTEPGVRVPAVDVRTEPMYFKLPLRLRSPETSYKSIGDRLYQPIYNDAFETVQENWWRTVPGTLAQRYLSSAFSGNLTPQRLGESSRFATVSGIGSPSSWTPDQRRAWFNYERALQKSVVDTEKDYIKEVDRRLKAQRAEEKRREERAREEEKRRKERERAEEKRRKERERAERAVAIETEGEQARQREWDALVREGERQYWLQQGVPKSMPIKPSAEQEAAAFQFAQEWAALQGAFLGPSKAPEVQKHLRKLRQEAAARRAREPGRLPGVEIGDWQRPPGAEPLELAEEERERQRAESESSFFAELTYRPKFGAKASRAQLARERAAEKLRGQLNLAIVPEERRALLARLKRVEAAAQKKSPPLPKRQRKQQRKRQWKDSQRFSLISPAGVVRTSAPRGRYSSPVAAVAETPIRVPRDVAERIGEQARARALAQLPPMPPDDGYDLAPMRKWRKRYNEEYATIRRVLWEEALAPLRAEEERKRELAKYLESADNRFTDLEIEPPVPTMTDEPVLDPDIRFEQLEAVDPPRPADGVVRDRFRDWYR